MVVENAVSSPTGVITGVSLSIQIIHDRREVRLVPIGEIDVHSASTFALAGELAVDELPDYVHIDLSQVTFMDSSGVRCIQSVIATAETRGVPCTVVGRDMELGNRAKIAPPLPVWSGSTTRWIGSSKD